MAPALDRLGGEVVRLRSRDGLRLAGRWIAGVAGRPGGRRRRRLVARPARGDPAAPRLQRVGDARPRGARPVPATDGRDPRPRPPRARRLGRRADDVRPARDRGRRGRVRVARRARHPARRAGGLVDGRRHRDRRRRGPGRRPAGRGGRRSRRPGGRGRRAASPGRRRGRGVRHAGARPSWSRAGCGCRSGGGSRVTRSGAWPGPSAATRARSSRSPSSACSRTCRCSWSWGRRTGRSRSTTPGGSPTRPPPARAASRSRARTTRAATRRTPAGYESAVSAFLREAFVGGEAGRGGRRSWRRVWAGSRPDGCLYWARIAAGRGLRPAAAGDAVVGRADGGEGPDRRRRRQRAADAPVQPPAGGLRGPHRLGRDGRAAAVAAGGAVADPPRQHDRGAGRLRGRHPHPRRGVRRPARPDHHADQRQGRAGQGPRAPGRRRRLPDQAVPSGRADRADEEPDRPLRAQRVAGGPPADGPRPRLLRGEGRRRDDDHRDQRRDRAQGDRPARRPGRRQPPVRRPPGVPGPRPRPQEHRRPRERARDGRRPRAEHRPAARLRRGPAARAAVARGGRPRDRRRTSTRSSSSCRACTTT